MSMQQDIQTLASAVLMLTDGSTVACKRKAREAVRDILIRHSARVKASTTEPFVCKEAIERLTGILWRMTDEFESDESKFYWRRAIKDFERVIYGKEPKDPIRPPKPRGTADMVRELLRMKAPWEHAAESCTQLPALFEIESPGAVAAKAKGAEAYGKPVWRTRLGNADPHRKSLTNHRNGWHEVESEPLPPVPGCDDKYLLIADGDIVRLIWADTDEQEWKLVTEGDFKGLETWGRFTHWKRVELPV